MSQVPNTLKRDPHGAEYTGGIEKRFNPPQTEPYYGYKPANIFEAINIASGRIKVIQREVTPQDRQSEAYAEANKRLAGKTYVPSTVKPQPTMVTNNNPVNPKTPIGMTMPEVLYFKGEQKRQNVLANFASPFLQVGYSVGQWLGFKTPPIPATPDFLNPNVPIESKAGYALGALVLVGLSTYAVGTTVQTVQEARTPKIPSEVTPGLVDVPDVYPTTLEGMKAEQAATQFGTMPRTALLDPTVEILLRPPVLEKTWTPESIFPFVPNPELTARVPPLHIPYGISTLTPALTGVPLATQRKVVETTKPQTPVQATRIETQPRTVTRVLPSTPTKIIESTVPKLLRYPWQEVKPQQEGRMSIAPITLQKTAQITQTLQIQRTTTPTYSTSTYAPRNPLDISPPTYRRRKQTTRTYLFGRQPRRYPILTGKPAFNLLFGQPQKRRKR